MKSNHLWSTDELKHFPKPKADAKLWKYFEPEYFEDFITNGALFFNRLCSYEDTSEAGMNQRQLDAMGRRLERQELENRRAFHEHIKRQSWACCFTTHEREQRHLYQRFCRNMGYGVAVGTTFEQLMAAQLTHVDCGLVRYEETDYVVEKVGYLLFQKQPKYSDEAEFRLCLVYPGKIEPQHSIRGFFKIRVLLDRMITCIAISPDAPKGYYERVCMMADRYLKAGRSLVRWSELPTVGD